MTLLGARGCPLRFNWHHGGNKAWKGRVRCFGGRNQRKGPKSGREQGARLKRCAFLFVLSFLGQKSRRTKVPRIYRIFDPNFAPNFSPNFPRIFRGLFVLRFVGNGDQKKFTKNPRHFSMQNSQANTKKIFTKCFWRGGKVMSFREEKGTQTQTFWSGSLRVGWGSST